MPLRSVQGCHEFCSFDLLINQDIINHASRSGAALENVQIVDEGVYVHP